MRPFLRSFRIHSLALALLSLLIITLVATDSLSNPSWVVGFPSRNHVRRQRRHSLLDTCSPLSHSQLCNHLEMIRRHQRPFPPPPPLPRSNKGSDYDIDPRYGVEKRLVPSGPNPLHN